MAPPLAIPYHGSMTYKVIRMSGVVAIASSHDKWRDALEKARQLLNEGATVFIDLSDGTRLTYSEFLGRGEPT